MASEDSNVIDGPTRNNPPTDRRRRGTARSWAFTTNNYTEADEQLLRQLSESELVQAIAVGREVGEACGTRHLQGHVQWRHPRSFVWVRKMLPVGSHIEIARSDARSFDYCTKAGDVLVCKRSPLRPGRRTDLDQLVEVLRTGGLQQAREQCPTELIKYPAGCRLYVSLGNPSPPRPNILVDVYYSPDTGTGKTYAATLHPDFFILTMPQRPTDAVWFDGYAGQSRLVLDEYNGQIPYRTMLRILDIPSYVAPIKGGTVPAHWTHVIITTNVPWNSWYPAEHDTSHLGRRIHNVFTRFPFGFMGPIPDAGLTRLYVGTNT